MCFSQSREQDPQVVVQLGRRADRGAGSVSHGLLFDGDGGRKAADMLDAWLGHLSQELPGIRRKRLDVATLALGVERIHRQRRLAAATRTAEDAQRVPRDLDVDVLKVML